MLRFPLPASLFPILFLACAAVQQPPGGPPDVTPPALLSVTPDSGSTLADLKKPAVFRFNEVISERPGVTLDKMVLLSPRTAAPPSVSWKRDAIEVRPRGGWQAGVPYQVTLLPGITDLRNNRLTTGRTVIFSTGGGIPATHVAGRVLDWQAGTAAIGALVELTRLPDSLVFWGLADSTGAYALPAVPPGRYVLTGTVDRNNNRSRDYREAFDSALVTLDSALAVDLWAVVRDSVGPAIRLAQRADSVTLRLEFNQALAPDGPPPGSIRVRALPDSTPVSVTAVQTLAAFDSARAARQRVPGDTGVARVPLAPAPVPRPPVAPVGPRRAGAPVATPRAAPDSAVLRLLATRPRLSTTWVLSVDPPLAAGGRYLINAAVPNPAGALGESASVLVVPAAPAPVRADTAKVGP